MSYSTAFSIALRQRHLAGELLNRGEFALCALANLDGHDSRHVGGDHDAHVRARYVDNATLMVTCALTNFCPPPVENDVASTVTAPAASGQVAGIPPSVAVPPIIGTPPAPGKSNLDLTGMRRVKKGAVVSWHGFRGRVSRVRSGYAYPEAGSPLHTNVGAWVACRSVQVVG